MKVATIAIGEETRAALVVGDELVVQPHPTAVTALNAGELSDRGQRLPLRTTRLLPPSPSPNKIVCVGLNYTAHIQEMGRDLPQHPTLFTKFARALVGSRDPITLPPESEQVDWEAELAVVIGRHARRVDRSRAAEVIAGYTVLNDISMRDHQWRTTQWLAGKTFEGSTPCGPWIVTPEEIGPGADLEITCEVDGQLMQTARTSDLVFDPLDLIAYISTIVTLEPGDIVSTGSPAGVGAGRTPPVFLRAGQVVRTRISGIGEMVNHCVDEVLG